MDPKTLQDRAERLPSDLFLGGPVESFESMGRLQLITLLRCGLEPDSRVLDLGCGALRGGFFVMHFLQPDRYFGIEPNQQMLAVGKDAILGADLVAQKRPRFATNERFDASEFGVQFDFVLARSVWTHASREQIAMMLDTFDAHGTDDSVFLTSYLPSVGRIAHAGEREHPEAWTGRSHESDQRGIVHHDLDWIERECRDRGLSVRELPVDRKRQVWLLIAKGQGARPSETYLADLLADESADLSLAKRLRKLLKRTLRRSAAHK